MRKSKASIFVLAILSIILLIAGVAMYFMTPSMGGGWTLPEGGLFAAFGDLFAVFQTLFTFGNKALAPNMEIGVVALDIAILVAMGLLVILWVVNLVLLILKKRLAHLVPNLAWLLAGGLSVALLALALVPVQDGSAFRGALYEGSGLGIEGSMVYYHDAIGCIVPSFMSESGKGFAVATIIFVAALLVAYILGLIAIIKSIGALIRSRNESDESISYEEENNMTNDYYEYEEQEEQKKPCECEEEVEEKEQAPTIIQNFYNGGAMPCAPYPYAQAHECHCHEHEEPEYEEDRPLTAKELRAIIRQELEEREHPEELEPLTDERAREIIQEELAEYYTSKGEGEAAEEESDVMTADDLRKMIKEEVEGAVKPSEGTSLTKEEVREIIREELGAPKEEKESLTSDEVRSIIAEELAKYLQNIAVVEEVEPKEEPAPEPEPEPEPEPVKEPEPEPEPEPAPAPASAPVIRLSFAEKVTAATKEVKDNYNDLKAYALGYGLKSRVANGGDTFRLHTKTYFRINMVGKGLKLYYALDPKDYAESPIPVQDVGHKNLYKDIPLCFKVRSGLSVKRAKQLIDDVCGKAGLTAGAPVDTRDYAADLINYVNDGTESEDDED